MFKLNLKIAWRNLWKNRGITAINIGGLSVALAAFILVIVYVTFETTYDAHNKNYQNIYLVGRNLPDLKTPLTSPPLAKAIKQNFPEVERAGKTKVANFEFPLISDHARVYFNNALQMDYEVAKIFDIKPDGGLKMPLSSEAGDLYLPRQVKKQLYPDKPMDSEEIALIGNRAMGMQQRISGTIDQNKHSNIDYDALAIWKEIGVGENYGFNNYKTYIQVKPGTDIENLSNKMDALYKKEIKAQGGWMANDKLMYEQQVIFLDPLKDLHLKPTAGSDANYKIVITLSILSLLILVIACINFTNLSISQANKRAKEVGLKKVMGAYRYHLTIQFLAEIFIQCLVALILGLILAEIAMPLFNRLIGGDLSILHSGQTLIWQLPFILVLITFISGLYPSLILSGYRPVYVLKGNLQTSHKTQLLRNTLLITQFIIAVIFITGLLIVNSQIKYMQSENPGFSPEQVVAIKNQTIFDHPSKFNALRERVKKIPGVLSATVATNIPGGSSGGTNTYDYNGKSERLKFIDVDFEYFETLNIKPALGRLLSREFSSDTATSVILNQAAVEKLGITNPIGATVKGCNIAYKVVGVVKDFKMQGFEHAVEPTVYTINDPCGNYKLQIMLKIDQHHMADVLATLKKNWSDINKLDGEDFRYDFLDDVYGQLFEKQEQLRVVFFSAAMLTIFIAVMGLFAFAAYQITNRVKEISVRKILGASDIQILKLLNSNFIRLVIIANIIAGPIIWLLAKQWLNSFAYRIEVPLLPFFIAGGISVLLTLITVSLQAGKAINASPVDALKYE